MEPRECSHYNPAVNPCREPLNCEVSPHPKPSPKGPKATYPTARLEILFPDSRPSIPYIQPLAKVFLFQAPKPVFRTLPMHFYVTESEGIIIFQAPIEPTTFHRRGAVRRTVVENKSLDWVRAKCKFERGAPTAYVQN